MRSKGRRENEEKCGRCCLCFSGPHHQWANYWLIKCLYLENHCLLMEHVCVAGTVSGERHALSPPIWMTLRGGRGLLRVTHLGKSLPGWWDPASVVPSILSILRGLDFQIVGADTVDTKSFRGVLEVNQSAIHKHPLRKILLENQIPSTQCLFEVHNNTVRGSIWNTTDLGKKKGIIFSISKPWRSPIEAINIVWSTMISRHSAACVQWFASFNLCCHRVT